MPAAVRLLALLLPQTLVSAAVAALFVHESGWAQLRWMRLVRGSHVGGVILAQALFLLVWDYLAKSAWGRRSGLAVRLFAATAFLAAATLNVSYVAQALVLHVWSSPLTPSIRQTLEPQLRYFVATIGAGPYLLLGAAGLLLAAGLAVAWSQAERLWAVRLWATPPRGTAAVCAAALVVGTAFVRETDGRLATRSDPVLSPWIGFDLHPESSAADLQADRAARTAYPKNTPFHRRNVIVIIIDCLRADHLPMFGYARNTAPFLQELAQAGRLHPVAQAFSAGNASKNGILAVLTSRYPEQLHVGNFTLPDVLRARGYRTHVIAAGDHTVFQSLSAYYAEHLDFYVDGLSAGRFTVNDDRNLLAATQRLPASDGTPAFFYFHFMSAHPVGVRRTESRRWPESGTERRGLWGRWRSKPGEVDAYDDGIIQADLYLRRLFALLEQKGYLRDYVAVITGDHGQSLGEHGISGHGRSLWQSEVRIPVFFLEAGKSRYPAMPFASQVDVAPTLLDLLGLPAPATWQGRSLLRSPPPTQAFLVASSPGTWRGLVEQRGGRRYKYLFDAPGSTPWREKLFELTADDAEVRDLTGAVAPELLAGFRRAAGQHFSIPPPP